MMRGFKWLARFKFLRGTPFDPFGYSADRKLERQLVADYERDVETVLGKLAPQTVDAAVALLALPETIRGYGPIKDKAASEARRRRSELLAAVDEPAPVAPRQLAAE